MKTLLTILMLGAVFVAEAAPKQVRVFVALCDNKTQGIVPVGEKIGNGDEPDANLYWGCSDGLGSYFRRTGRWRVAKSEKNVSPTILRRLELKHADGSMDMVAEAYRGADMRQCLKDFEEAAASHKYDLVAFIGHNGLMDFSLPVPRALEGNRTDAIVLCCQSEKYFGDRLRSLGCRPLLMTQQLMYPGSFLLHAALEDWKRGGSVEDIRTAAATAYAKNQKISMRAATGVFSPPVKPAQKKHSADESQPLRSAAVLAPSAAGSHR